MEGILRSDSVKRLALVTGANRGLGKEVARQLQASGLRVICGARSLDNDLPGIPLVLDVTNKKHVLETGEYIRKEFGRLDILVNNAGIYPDDPRKTPYKSIFELDMAAFNEALHTNLLGAAAMMWELMPLMREARYGRVVNVSSGMGRFGDLDTNGPFYRVSKAGLNALTKIVAQEVLADNILVNAVCPGWVKTDMGGENALRTIEEGARGVVWAAMLPDGGPSGKFFRDGKELDWCSK